MGLIDIALRSIRRHPGKIAFLVLGLTIAVSTVVILHVVAERMNEDVSASLDEFGANVVMLPKTDDLSLTYGSMSISGVTFDTENLRESDIALIRTIHNSENISTIAPKLISAIEVAGKRTLVVGVDFRQEKRLKRWWTVHGSLPSGPREALIGAEASSKLALTRDRRFAIQDTGFVVSGVLEPTGSQDDGLVFIDLHRAQALFHKADQVSAIEIAARCYDCPIDEIVRQISEAVPRAQAIAIRQAIESRMEAMHRFESFSLGVSGIVLVIGALIVLTNMTSSVNQRTREIGIFRAVGFRQRAIIAIILAEAFLVSAAAGVAGFLAGSGLAVIVTPVFGLKTALGMADPSALGLSVGLAVFVGLAGSVYPAIRASRLDPDVALRTL